MATNTTIEAVGARVGWVSSPNGRGTIDIIWSCVLTTTLCVWTILCLNVPARKTTFWQFSLTKLKWMLVTLFGPEWLLAVAGGQWSQARLAVQAFRKTAIPWTMRQAFFAEMGGIRVKMPDHDDFPVTSRHLLGLIELGLLDPDVLKSKVTLQEIDDRSKIDGLGKLLFFLQTSWFMLQSVTRLAQHLPVTTVELSTIALTVCTLGTHCLWWHKPKDVLVPIVLDLAGELDGTTVEPSKVVQVSGKTVSLIPSEWTYTPMERFDDLRPNFLDDVVLAHFSRISFFRKMDLSQEQRLQRLRNDRLPPVQRHNGIIVFQMIVALCFGAVYVAGWNVAVPTDGERIAWRVCIMILMSLIVAYIFVDFLVLVLGVQSTQAQDDGQVPAVMVYILTPVAASYILTRFYLIIEPWVGLRSLPPGAYESVQWLQAIPHV